MEESIKINPFHKYWLCLVKGFRIIIAFIFLGISGGILVGNFIAKDTDLIQYKFRYTENVDFDYNNIVSSSNIEKVKGITTSWYTGGKISTYAYVDIKNITISKAKDEYLIEVNKDAFNLQNKEGIVEYNDTAAKGFLRHLAFAGLPDSVITDYNNQYTYEKDGKTIQGISQIFDVDFFEKNSLNEGILIYQSDNSRAKVMTNSAIIGLLASLILGLVFILIFVDKLDMNIVHEYDNVTIYKTPFHKSFFTGSLGAFKKTKSIVLMASLLAMVTACKFIPIPSGFGELGLSFTYLFLALAAMIFGPIPSLALGVYSDVIGFIIKPSGIFNPMYTIIAMISCFIYALCFHKTHITFNRCFVSRILVSFGCNVILGTFAYCVDLWMISSTVTWGVVNARFILELSKNVVYLLPQSILLYIFLRAISKPLGAFVVIDEKISNNISFF